MVVFYFTTENAEFNAELHRGYLSGFLLLKQYWVVGDTTLGSYAVSNQIP
jgi:hypothetical protein